MTRRRINLTDQPGHLFSASLPELALALGVTKQRLRRQAEREGRETRIRRHRNHFRPVVCLTQADAAALRAHYAAHPSRPDDLAHWPTVDQAAHALCMTTTAFHQSRTTGRLKGRIEARTMHGPGVTRRCVRYNPADVEREARALGIRPVHAPRGAVPTRNFRRLFGLSKRTLARWTHQRGCPYGVLGNGEHYYYPERVLAWMDTLDVADFGARPQAFEAARERLRAHLTQERAA